MTNQQSDTEINSGLGLAKIQFGRNIFTKRVIYFSRWDEQPLKKDFKLSFFRVRSSWGVRVEADTSSH